MLSIALYQSRYLSLLTYPYWQKTIEKKNKQNKKRKNAYENSFLNFFLANLVRKSFVRIRIIKLATIDSIFLFNFYHSTIELFVNRFLLERVKWIGRHLLLYRGLRFIYILYTLDTRPSSTTATTSTETILTVTTSQPLLLCVVYIKTLWSSYTF